MTRGLRWRRGRNGTGAWPHQLRRPGFRALPATVVRPVDRLLDGGARAPDRGDRRLGQRLQRLSSSFPRARGCRQAGRPRGGRTSLEFPTISLGEVFLEPTSMLYRNLMSMDVEEMVRAQPMDAVVLVGGCDKTVPAQLMGAASAGVPAVRARGGTDDNGTPRGRALGACTDCRRFWDVIGRGRSRASRSTASRRRWRPRPARAR